MKSREGIGLEEPLVSNQILVDGRLQATFANMEEIKKAVIDIVDYKYGPGDRIAYGLVDPAEIQPNLLLTCKSFIIKILSQVEENK